jgi:ABC-2 type transport system permease protein
MKEIIKFELYRAFHKPAIYIYWALFFFFGFFTMNAAGGAFDSIRMNVGGGDAVHINSPGTLDVIFGMFTYIGIIILASITAPVAFRDFRSRTTELVFATPIKRNSYIYGGFITAFVLNVFAITGLAFGTLIGTLMPYLNDALFGEFMLKAYVNPYLFKVIPNVFFVTAIFYSLTLLRRNVMMNWLTIIGLYLLYALGQNFMADLDTQTLAAILDPFGIVSTSVSTSDNSAQDMNTQAVALESIYLINRVVWISFGVLLLLLTQWRFSMLSHVRQALIRRRKKAAKNNGESYVQLSFGEAFPKGKSVWNIMQQIRAFTSHLNFDVRYMFGSLYFWAIVLFAIIFMFSSSTVIGQFYETETYPVTYQVIYILSGTISIFIYLFITLFTGEILWRDRSSGIHEIVQSQYQSPIKQLWSKFLTVNAGVVMMMFLMVICGVIVQAFRGYYNFELGLYFDYIFNIKLIDYVLLVFLAFFIHVIINHKYAGHVAMLAFFLIKDYVLETLVQHNLLIYGGAPQVMYSDMNGWGYDVTVMNVFKFYWLAVALVIFVITSQLWVDGTESNRKARILRFKQKFTLVNKSILTGLVVLAVLIGGWIFYNTNVLNDFKTAAESKENAIAYEQKYKKYENAAQPKIVETYLDVDIQPENKYLGVDGFYWIKNKTNEAITEIHLNYSKEIRDLSFSDANAKIVDDEVLGFYVYELAEELLPGDSLKLNFKFISVPEGFTNNGYQTIVNPNGTFFYNSSFPSIGYNAGRELSNKLDREHEGLSERLRVRPINDEIGLSRNFITPDADFIRYEAIIRTSSDQTGITPGKLLSQRMVGGRNIFHYKAERPMINYYAILSAHYEKMIDVWHPENDSLEPVELAILYHPSHTDNLEMMMKAMKQSLSFYSKHFTPYQFSQLNIVEFPRYSSFAQSFPNMIPYSEGIGFIADLRGVDEEDVDFEELKVNYPYWFIAHEIAHQWWAHQVIAADVEGAQFLMESVTQFSAYKVVEDVYGSRTMRKAFREEAYKYLNNRKREHEEEVPLYKVANTQSTIYYQKGALSLFGMNELLGNNQLLNVLKEFAEQFAYHEAPYPNSLDLINIIDRHTPDSLKFAMNDYFKKLTFYDFELKQTQYKRTPHLEYFVDLTFDISKVYADGVGKETETDFEETIPIGLLDDKDQLLEVIPVKVKSGENKVTVKLRRKPAKAILDPLYQKMAKEYMREAIDVVMKK